MKKSRRPWPPIRCTPDGHLIVSRWWRFLALLRSFFPAEYTRDAWAFAQLERAERASRGG